MTNVAAVDRWKLCHVSSLRTRTSHEIGGGTFGMDELVPAPDVKYPATSGPTEQYTHI